MCWRHVSDKMKITQERLKELLYYNLLTGLFIWMVRIARHVRAGEIAGTVNKRGYISIIIDGKSYQAHRLAFLYMTGEWPKGDVDHRNDDENPADVNRRDNRWCNLRDGTHRANCSNRKRHREGMPVGVHFDKKRNKYVAQIQIKRKRTFLGYFTTKEQASEAYQKALKEIA